MKATIKSEHVFWRATHATEAIKSDIFSATCRLSELENELRDSIKQDSKTTSDEHGKLLAAKTLIQQSMSKASKVLAIVERIKYWKSTAKRIFRKKN